MLLIAHVSGGLVVARARGPRARFFERRIGAQARNLVRVGALVPGEPSRAPGKTPRTSRGGLIAVKVVGGGSVKALPRRVARVPGGGEAQEGRGPYEPLTGPARHRTPAGSKALKARAALLARVKPQAGPSNDTRA